jgi:hypothetical protein
MKNIRKAYAILVQVFLNLSLFVVNLHTMWKKSIHPLIYTQKNNEPGLIYAFVCLLCFFFQLSEINFFSSEVNPSNHRLQTNKSNTFFYSSAKPVIPSSSKDESVIGVQYDKYCEPSPNASLTNFLSKERKLEQKKSLFFADLLDSFANMSFFLSFGFNAWRHTLSVNTELVWLQQGWQVFFYLSSISLLA